MKNSVFYNVYIFFLLIFFWRTALFWSDDNTMGVEGKDYILYISLVIVELLSLYLIITFKKNKSTDPWIHRLCFGWEIVMLAVLLFNNGSIGHYPKVLAWPLLFEAAYLIVKSYPRMIKSFRKA